MSRTKQTRMDVPYINNFECAIVIPVYKEDISADEEVSLQRCLEILREYQVIFVAPYKLNCAKYQQICAKYKMSVSCEFFKKKFFRGYNGYNTLLVCSDFYKRFLNYTYILIYQLDAFVFENSLSFWCKQGYDYIGAPFFDLPRGAATPQHTNHLNGGLSLRKTESFYKLAKTKLHLSFFYLSSKNTLQKKITAFNMFYLLFLLLVTRILQIFFKVEVGEDFEWSSKIRKYGNIAPFEKALQFSFDSCPEYAFKLNNNTLPFGCHGWTTYYNRQFWKKFNL